MTTSMDIKLSSHFTLTELTRSATAQRLGLDNTPDAQSLDNLRALATNLLEPLRQLYGSPIYVTSGYRCPDLNAVVGGAASSQHSRGQAADIKGATPEENRKLLGLLLANPDKIPFDQVIAEKCDKKGNPTWLHVSFSTKQQRSQVLYN